MLQKFTVIGDSNMRNACTASSKLSLKSFGFELDFKLASAYLVGLEHLKDAAASNSTLVLVDFITNGLVDTVDAMIAGPEFDQAVEQTLKEYVEHIEEAAKRVAVLVVLLPLQRSTPKWFNSKHGLISEYLKARFEGTKIRVIPNVAAGDGNFSQDGVHLNTAAISKVYPHVVEQVFERNISPLKKFQSTSGSVKKGQKRSEAEMKTTTEIASEGVTAKQKRLVESRGGINAKLQSIAAGPSGAAKLLEDVEDAGMDESGSVEEERQRNFSVMPTGDVIGAIRDEFSKFRAENEAVVNRVADVEVAIVKLTRRTSLIPAINHQVAESADIADAALNATNDCYVMVSGIRDSKFQGNLTADAVARLLLAELKLVNVALTSTQVASYPVPKDGNKSDLKLLFATQDMARRFRVAANKQRVDKIGLWDAVYVSNLATKATRVRASLMMSLTSKLAKVPNHEGEKFHVSRFDSRPRMFFKKGEGANARIVKTMSFSDAMMKYGGLLTDQDKTMARKIAGTTFGDRLGPLFIVL